MDKETLSNYGWIVICILVLSVMIALATPFGTYVSNAVKSTTKGLNDTSDKAMCIIGLNCKGEWSDSGNNEGGGNTPTAEIKREAGSVIPTGAKYTIKASNTVLEGNGANVFPDAPETGDTYEEGAYEYHFNQYYYASSWQTQTSQDGWGVIANSNPYDPCDEVVQELCSYVSNKPVTTMCQTFRRNNLPISPKIPNTITDMESAFEDCTSLTTAPILPANLICMDGTFWGCTSLKTYEGSTDPDGDFSNYKLPDGVINMKWTFEDCKCLTAIPKLPNKVKELYQTFRNCYSIGLVTLRIPSNVTDVTRMFENCTSLTGKVEFNNKKALIYDGMFSGTQNKIIIKYTGPTGVDSQDCTQYIKKTSSNRNIEIES